MTTTVLDGGCGCSEGETVQHPDGSTVSTARDGTVTTTTTRPDPRLGVVVPVLGESRTRLPSGLTRRVQASRTVELAEPGNPFSLTRQTDTVTVNGKASTTVYEHLGGQRRRVHTSAAGRQRVELLDERGRVVGLAIPGLAAVQYTYTAEGLLSSIVEGGRVTGFSYDALGRLAGVSDPLGRVTGYQYDAAGRLVRQILPDGREILFTYDGSGNLTSLTPPSRPAHGFAYTAVNLQSEYAPPPVGPWDPATRYAYDGDGKLTQVQRPDGQQVSFAYTGEGKLGSIASPLGSITFSYDLQGRLASIVTPDGQGLTWAYDGFLEKRVTSSGTVQGTLERVFDADFRVSQLRLNGQALASFAYDPDGLLTQAGPLSITRHPQTGFWLGSTAGVVEEARSYSSFGELESQECLESGIEVEYVIDGRNRRVGKKVNGQLVQGFLYDHQLRIVAELDGAQQVVARFIYADGINVPELMEKNGRTYRLLHDHLGSPRLVVDIATGEVAQELAYDAWGNLMFDSNPGFQPFGFAGGLHDPHTRLIRFGARDYDPHLGRWTTKDVLLFAALDAQLYSYGFDDPLSSTDPSGLASTRQVACILEQMTAGSPLYPPLLSAEAGAATGVFVRNYRFMRRAATKGADKYFHCMANCQASRFGTGGGLVALIISEGREFTDRWFKGHPPDDSRADQEANRCGRRAPDETACRDACAHFRPPQLDPRY